MIEDVDVTFMHQAIKLAKKGRELNEVPVGAIVTFKGEIVGKGYNQCIQNQDDLIPNVIAQKLIVFVSMICIFLVTFAFSDKLNQNKKYAGT